MNGSGKADYVLSGQFSTKAYQEAQEYGDVKAVASSKEINFSAVPKVTKADFREDADYAHICFNNTIYGTKFYYIPETGNIPLVDFRQPAEPVMYDSTAAGCAACGMLEIAKHVPEFEKALYENGAINMMKATMEKFCNWDPEYDSILDGGTVAYHRDPSEIHVPIIYGDYFMVEFIVRLLGKDLFIW
jgi:hypothetical protein